MPAALPDLDRTALRRPKRHRAPDKIAAQLQQAVALTRQVEAGLPPHLAQLEPALRPVVAGYLGLLSKLIADHLTQDAPKKPSAISPEAVMRLLLRSCDPLR